MRQVRDGRKPPAIQRRNRRRDCIRQGEGRDLLVSSNAVIVSADLRRAALPVRSVDGFTVLPVDDQLARGLTSLPAI